MDIILLPLLVEVKLGVRLSEDRAVVPTPTIRALNPSVEEEASVIVVGEITQSVTAQCRSVLKADLDVLTLID